MHLKLARTQRRGGAFGGTVLFALNARADLSRDEHFLVRKYRLGGVIVYDSEGRKRYAEAAYGHFNAAATTPGWDAKAVARSMWKNVRGIASLTMAAMSLRITINGLIGGQHIECRDLNELLGAEAAILEACANLRMYLRNAAAFDGREEVVEF